ncbi:MAG: trimethylamine methyltransferase family protein [Pseudomonadota bacterium]
MTPSRSSAHRRRQRRRTATAAPVGTPVRQPSRHLPPVELLSRDELDRVEHQAEWLLESIGIAVLDHPETTEKLVAAGCDLRRGRVHFPAGLAKQLCSTAPRRFTLHARDPAYSVDIGGDSLVFSPGYGAPFVRDLAGERRYATLDDFRNFVRLTWMSPWLQHSGGTVCEPVDVPVNKRHLDMVYAHIKYSAKPFMGSVTSKSRAEDSIDLARLVFGERTLNAQAVIQGNVNVNSPLTFDATMLDAIKVYAEAGQALLISPFMLSGAMGPVTIPGLVAQAHAETLVGIAIAQLYNPGAPVIYGNFISTLDLKSGAPAFGTPEAGLAALMVGQLCRRLGLPLRTGGHLTAAKIADAQAMQESVNTMHAGMQAGANFVLQSAGWLEGGLVMGYDKFVMDLDHLGMVHRLYNGIQIDDDSLATAAHQEAGASGDYIGCAHTYQHFRDANYRSDIADNDAFEQWQENGGLSHKQRATARCRKLLESYSPPPLDSAIDAALCAFIAQRKETVPDRWH